MFFFNHKLTLIFQVAMQLGWSAAV